ncbi:MAG: hypothetical protein ACI4T8_02925 [Christensenellales bacterium]
MSLESKIVVSIMSILGCLSVMATGVYAILYTNNYRLQNNSTLAMTDVCGKLYGYRYGAGFYDITDSLLYVDGKVADEQKLQDYISNVNFGTTDHCMEYILHFVVDEGASAGTWIELTNHQLTENSRLTDRYQFIMQETEPTLEEWEKAQDIDGTLMVDLNNRHIWLRALLKEMKKSEVEKIAQTGRELVSYAQWTFTFSFTGIGEK